MAAPRTAALEPVGLVGLGLMGQGIATCLIANGLRVIAHNRTHERVHEAREHIEAMLRELVAEGLVPASQVAGWPERFTFAKSIDGLAPCPFIIETVKEDLALKRRTYDALEAVVSRQAVIASNTSSFPASTLQVGRRHPGRFIVMHWSEPAAITRYLEVVPGGKTTTRVTRITREFGLRCGKQPTVLNVDLHGFISNRLMYAMMREACHLVELGVADVATVDQSFRNDIGWWATIAGPFRWMDLTGLPAYAAVMEGLFPHLSDAKQPSELIRQLVASGARGLGNGHGWYRYTEEEARRWEQAWVDFTFDIRRLTDAYDARTEGRRGRKRGPG